MILDAATGRPRGFVSVDGAITAATSDGHGGWYIAGGFSKVDGVQRSNLAHIDGHGSLDQAWRPPQLLPELTSPFLSVALQGRKVLVVGPFRSAGGRPAHGAVALNRDTGSVNPRWRPPKVCADGNWEVAARADRIYLATACAAPPCLVRLDPSSGAVSDWTAQIVAIGEIGCVNSVATSAGVVAFTGGFTQVEANRATASQPSTRKPAGWSIASTHTAAVLRVGTRSRSPPDSPSSVAMAAWSGRSRWPPDANCGQSLATTQPRRPPRSSPSASASTSAAHSARSTARRPMGSQPWISDPANRYTPGTHPPEASWKRSASRDTAY